MGTTAMLGIAGCAGSSSGDGGDDIEDTADAELGERVPTVIITFFTDQGSWTAEAESFLPGIAEELQDGLGISVDLEGQEVGGLIPSTQEDRQTEHIHWWPQGLTPDRLDPDEYTQAFTADGAGNPNALNHANYASCEYSTPAEQQATAATPDERQELVTEAWSVASEDVVAIPVAQIFNFGAVRSDLIDVPDLGERGLALNMTVPARVTVNEGDQLVYPTQPYVTEHPNWLMSPASAGLNIWGKLFHSPLLYWDDNYELSGMLAEDWTIQDEGSRFTFTLRDATFHNGDPITAEDVQFTFQHLWDNADVFPLASPFEYDSIEVVDDQTVEFNFPQPLLPFETKVATRWGILHKQSWVDGGAPDDPSGFEPDPLIGSGAFSLSSIELGQHLIGEAHDGHPLYSPDHDIFLNAFTSNQSMQNAFRDGELHILEKADSGTVDRLADELGDSMERITTVGFHSMNLHPQHSFGPTQFPVFNRAIGATFDRARINGLVYDNRLDVESLLYGCMFQASHPYRPPEEDLYKFTDDPTGDSEAARTMLEDAGWGWQDGNLHYPADVDPSPQWPADGRPDPDDYPCYDSNWDFVPPEDR